MKLLLLLTPLFLLLGSAATAQEIPTNNEELLEYLFGDEEEGDDIFRESMREKIRISESQLVRILAARDAAESKEDPMTESGRSSSAAFNETAVSGGTDIEAELHAAINPTDSSNIVVGVIDMFSKTQGFGAPATTGIYYSRDFGRTWQKSRTILISEGYSSVIGGGDPMFAFDADGTLYYSWIDLALQGQGSLKNAMSWAVSKNGGETWELGEGTIGDGLLGGRNREMFDKQWMIVDRTNSPYRGTLYTGLLHITSSTGGSGRVGLRHKAPDSDRFTTETVLPAGPAFAYNQLASTAIGPDGKLHLMFFGSSATDPGQMALWLTGSSDGGKSLVAPQKITNIEVPVRSAGQEQGTLIGFDQQRIQPSSHIAADAFSTGPHAGNLYAVWAANGVDQKEATGMDIYFTRSTDGGATWQDPWIVNDDGDPETGGREAVDQFHPSIAVNDRGIVTLTWYDRRNDPGNRMTDYYAAHSFDGGVSFTNSYPISSAPSDFSRIGGRNGDFGIGEYVQTVTTDGFAIPVWSDGRKNNGDVDVYIAFAPLSRNPTGVERVGSLSDGLAIERIDLDATGESAQVVVRSEKNEEGRLELIDPRGGQNGLLYSGRINRSGEAIPFSTAALPSGTWYLRLSTETGEIIRKFQITR